MNIRYCFCILLFFIFSVSSVFSEITGHLKQYAIYNDANSYGDDNILSYTTCRLDYKQEIKDKYLFNIAYELSEQFSKKKSIGVFPFFTVIPALPYRLADLKINPTSKKHNNLYQNLDRLLVNISLPKTDIIIGRQPITLGISREVSPFDIIMPYPFYAIDKEYRLGVDAVRTVFSLSDLSELECGYVFGKNFSYDKSLFYCQSTVNIDKTDIGAIGAYFQGNYMLGMNLQMPIFEAGVWVEASYVLSKKKDQNYFRLTTGIDYKLTKEIYAFVEYHYNGPGSDNKNKYYDNLFQTAYLQGEVYFFGKHYLLPGMNIELTPLINLSTLLVYNLSDNSCDLNGTLQYNVSDNLYLDFSALIGLGAPYTEFKIYPNRYYASLRYYF